LSQDTFTRATPVSGGIGKLLLEKMGWKAGSGLGKHSEGITAPIPVEIKTDRKGE
jgi:G-patch domain